MKKNLLIIALGLFTCNVIIGQQIGGSTGVGKWSSKVNLPLIPVAVANLPDGRLLMFSADHTHSFNMGAAEGDLNEHTATGIYDPASKTTVQNTVGHAHHNMFCPGINNLPDGKILVTGGISSKSTSIYDPVSNSWSSAANMNVGRGYQGSVTMNSGVPFVIGGSWSGGPANKLAEIWTPDGGWFSLANLSIDQTIRDGVNDPQGQYRDDNHAWLWAAPNGKIFHAGPSSNMHWLSLDNGGSFTNAGPRGNDTYAMQGITVMYDKGKILKAGGSQSYSSNTPASNKSFTIDINQTNVIVNDIPDMKWPRIFHNCVVLPNGEVFVVGGMDHAEPFSDVGSVKIPEVWNPVSQQWRELAPMSVPRNYHSTAILLHDGSVFVGGGGLCGTCAANHADAEIYYPSYLFTTSNTDAVRPQINSWPATAAYSSNITVSTSSAVSYFSLIRMSSNTHSTNNEQRYLRLNPTATSGLNYTLNIGNASILPPGYYMLFAVNGSGVPSVAKSIKIGSGTPICTIKPEYVINGVRGSGRLSLGVAAGKSVSLSMLPDGSGLTIKKPDGSTAGDNFNLGNVIPSQSGRYVFTSAQGCVTRLDLTVTNCISNSLLPEYNLQVGGTSTWYTGTPNQTLEVARGTVVTLSATPNDNPLDAIILPNGREVIDNFSLGAVTPYRNGVYRFLSSKGCTTTLNIAVPCDILPEYNINGVWAAGTPNQVVSVNAGAVVTLSTLPNNGVAFKIKKPDGSVVSGDYYIGSFSAAQSGVYTFTTEEGCATTLTLQMSNYTTFSIIPASNLNSVWNAASQNSNLATASESSLYLRMLPNGTGVTLKKPYGVNVSDNHFIGNVTAAQNGIYTLTSSPGFVPPVNCNPIRPEYLINGIWYTGIPDQNLVVANGSSLTLSIIPNGLNPTIKKPDGTTSGDNMLLTGVTATQSGLYTFTSSEGCKTTLNLTVAPPL